MKTLFVLTAALSLIGCASCAALHIFPNPEPTPTVTIPATPTPSTVTINTDSYRWMDTQDTHAK